ncbi:MAG: hypothetical protein GXX04_08900 [Clostridiaceae bacterium]|nr:hypothetical protein [Clostridiaceae bacterium]
MKLDKIVTSLSQVRGIKAIALGGSRSRGEAGADSDFDIGIYYDGDFPETYNIVISSVNMAEHE